MSAAANLTPRIVARSLGWSTVGTVVTRLGNVAVSLVVARLIAPTEFGVFAVALTVWTICGTMAEFGLGTDLVRAKDIDARMPTVATLGLATSGALALGMFLASDALATAFESPQAAGVIRVMSLSMLAFGFSIVPAALLQRQFRQSTLFAINMIGLVISTVITIALASHGFGAMSLAIAQVSSQTIVVVAQFVAVRRLPTFGFDRGIAAQSVRFCLPLAAANMLSWVLLSLDNLIVSRTLGTTALGYYALAFNVSSWPMSAVGQSIRAVALPALAHIETPGRRNSAIGLLSGPLWTLSILLGLGLASLATPLVALLYGPRWSAAAPALVGLAVFGGLRVVLDFLATLLIAAGETTAVLLTQIWWLGVMVPVMWLGVSHYGLLGAGWAHVAVAVAGVLPAYLYCLTRVGVRVRSFMGGALFPALVAIPVAFAVHQVSSAFASPLAALAAGGVSALVLFLAPTGPRLVRQLRLLRDLRPRVTDVEAPVPLLVPTTDTPRSELI